MLQAWPVGADAAVAGPDWPYGGLWRGGWGKWPERAFWWLWRAVRACGGPRGVWCGSRVPDRSEASVPEPPRSPAWPKEPGCG